MKKTESSEAKRWMASEDSGQYLIAHRFRMKLLLSVTCSLLFCISFIEGNINNELSVNEIYEGCHKEVLLTLLYLLSDDMLFATERVRLGALLSFRIFHGRRIKADYESGKQVRR